MDGPETSPDTSSPDNQAYSRGEPVRVYVERDGELTAEDDWQYRTYEKGTDLEVAAKHAEEGGVTEFSKTPKPEFDIWQRERAAEEAGRLAAAATIENTPAADEVVNAEEAEENEHRPSWGKFNEDGVYELTADPEQLAAELDIPAAVIVEAAKKGFPPEFLLSARQNHFSAKRLRRAGIDWGAVEVGVDERLMFHELQRSQVPPKPPKGVRLEELSPSERQVLKSQLIDYLNREATGEELLDPIFKQVAKGTLTQIEVQDIADKIEQNPRAIKKELVRPGELPLELHRIPFIGRSIGRLALARAAHRGEIRERKRELRRREEETRTTGIDHVQGYTVRNYEDGLLRIGIPRTRRNLAYIKRQDEDVRVLRNKLRFLNSHEYKGPEKQSARRDLAELIHRTQRRHEALAAHRIHHEDVYLHEPFAKDYKEFNRRKSGGE